LFSALSCDHLGSFDIAFLVHARERVLLVHGLANGCYQPPCLQLILRPAAGVVLELDNSLDDFAPGAQPAVAARIDLHQGLAGDLELVDRSRALPNDFIDIGQVRFVEDAWTREDNGGGISPEEIENIFSLFVSHKGNRGTGLGLPVSDKIMKEHGGRIHVESEVGRGSRFTLELPAVLPEGARPTAEIQLPPST